ncbi:MAG: hypothetical protein E6K80_02830 [Candidatus Eisenbacteria bacterium]|uniref:Uncharacterized protein n=1 Tax=Eiseniibacteriota bacterium TaxID=2212470 RepID=A0A538U965_UNCEI|nr:MAG: hypothetical protein E6K80_02830 [Candidatus Eisenbacteria bacterium]
MTETLRVAVEDIRWASIELPSGVSVGGDVVLGLAMGVSLFVVLIVIASRHAKVHDSGCQSYPPPTFLSRAPLTRRPFDLSRRCWLDDPLTMGDGEREESRGTPELMTRASHEVPPRRGGSSASRFDISSTR